MIESKIIEAQVYREGAIVRRRFFTTLQEGAQKLDISGLTETTDTDSIRLFAPSGLTISDVQIEWLSEKAEEEQTKPLTDEINAIQDELDLIELQIQLWKNNSDFANRKKISVQDISQYLTELPRTIKQLVEERRVLSKKLTKLKDELDKKETQLNKPILKIAVEVAKTGDYSMEFTYKELLAYWHPSYEVHSNSETESLMLRLTGKVSQNTDEDWRDINLTLFTGNPNVSAKIPALSSKKVKIASPIQPSYSRPRVAASRAVGFARRAAEEDSLACASMEEEVDNYQEELLEPVRLELSSSSRGETMMEYKLPGSWTIPQEQEIITHIEEKTLPCQYHNIAVPELSSYAFLAARVENKLLDDIQNTATSIYLNETFVGKAIIELDIEKETSDISLGIDESIKVKRIQKRHFTSVQMLKGQKKLENEFEIIITSQKPKPILMTVKERAPISLDKSIQVENLKHEGAKFDPLTGLIEWEHNLTNEAPLTLSLSFTLVWPKDKELEFV